MYLKSIEIQGFKSFANKILFEFHDGITGIVGPNGSGKSNVADAVRWVLGEQSAKQLRGSKMEDIIFSGTETRKPLGFAYVAITMDNKDHKLPIEFEEVTVARRVYRSGESEYLINKSTCRLRDVQELFLDTGIGKEGYSIIGQGQIDKILSGKPEDRRELFDEAAGIVKFKKRKASAEKNLEDEKQNLCRINDILIELEKQSEPLEKQAESAKVYLKYKEELKIFDVNLFLNDYDKIKNSEKELDEKLIIANHDLENSKKEYEDTKEEYDKLESKIESFTNELEEKKTICNKSKVQKEQQEGNLKVCNEQILAANQSDEHFRKRMNEINDDIIKKTKELEEYNLQKSDNDKKTNDATSLTLKEDTNSNEIKTKIENYSKSIDNCSNAIFKSFNENTGIKTKMQRYETMLEQNNIKKVSLTQKILKNKSNEAEIIENLKIYEEKKNVIDETIKNIENENAKINNERIKVSEVVEELKKNQDEARQSYLKGKSKRDSLKNITERYEGYGNSIKKVMEQKEKYSGIIGVVADIIKVDKKYETALETALGGSIQNIVTDNETTAKNLISFLKTNKFGRATFLPLTSITNKNSFYNEKALQEQGVIGLASSLINVDEKFATLIEYLLGRIVVVDNINNAIALSKKYNYSLRIVTIEGELLSAGGSMSGGAYRNSSNLLSRRREIEDIEKQMELDKTNLNNIEKDIEEKRVIRDNKKILLEENKVKMQELFIEQNTIKMNLEQVKSKQFESKSSLEEIDKENIEIATQVRALQSNIDSLTKELRANEENKKANEERINELTILLSKEKEKEEEQNTKSATMKLELSSLLQSSKFILENVKRVIAELNKLQNEEKDMKTNLNNSKEQVINKQNLMKETKQLIEHCNNDIIKLEEEIIKISKQKESISKEHKLFFTKRENLSEQINSLDKEVFRLNNQKEKLIEQLDNQINYMWEEYELTYNSALELKNVELNDFVKMKKSIYEMKIKIKNLGDVNVNAIEDYKNVMERYEELKSQRDDLVEAEKALLLIIEELDTEMRKQFSEKFAQIKSQFDIVFKELFGGGKGTLELIEDEDILEAGIRIIAQPPGKKLQNMMQLSGGEKALTAISLLFSIQNLKPSPFCLLDEIEAALDDSNVKRYAAYLHKLTKNTQFIVITHRRGTMSAADILYGITMQEKGVSTLVSVNLIEDELDK